MKKFILKVVITTFFYLIDSFSSEPIVKQMIETKFELNPIGVLQELCMAYHWELPHYECFKELCNESNKFKFIVICSLKSFRSKGMFWYNLRIIII